MSNGSRETFDMPNGSRETFGRQRNDTIDPEMTTPSPDISFREKQEINRLNFEKRLVATYQASYLEQQHVSRDALHRHDQEGEEVVASALCLHGHKADYSVNRA